MGNKAVEIRSFTGIRGVAALYVVLYHFGLYDLFTGPLHHLLRHGYMAVDLFFVLSGFVIAFNYQSYFQNGFTLENFNKFIERRLARIYPLYISVILFAVACIYFYPVTAPFEKLDSAGFLYNVLMIQAWGLDKSYVGPAWSISTEWAAYLIFPFLISITVFCTKKIAITTGVIAFTVLTLLTVLPETMTYVIRSRGPLDMSNGLNYAPLVRCILEFTIGILVYRAYATGSFKFLYKKYSASILAIMIVALLAIPSSDILIVYLIPLWLLSLSDDKSVIARFLGWKPIYLLGVISYSLYLVHIPTYIFRPYLRYHFGYGTASGNLFGYYLPSCSRHYYCIGHI